MKRSIRKILKSFECCFLSRNLPFIFIIFILFAALSSLKAQEEKDPVDPLLGDHAVGISDEIVFLWADFTSTSGGYFYNKIYDYISFNNPDLSNQINSMSRDSFPGVNSSKQFLDAFAEDLDGDGMDEIVESWAGDVDNQIQLTVRQVDSTDFSFIEVSNTNVLGENELSGTGTLVRLVPGDFDPDPGKEFILSFLTGDSLKIILFDTDEGLVPLRKTSIQDEAIYLNNNSINYDITAGDLDGDGTDEIILTGGERSQVYNSDIDDLINKEFIYVKIYDVMSGDEYQIEAKSKKESIEMVNDMVDGAAVNYSLNGLRVTSVDMDNNGIDEIALGYQVYDNKTYFLLQTLAVTENLNSIQLADSSIIIHQEVQDERGGSMSLTAADMTGDGKEEVIFAAWNKLAVYDADNNLKLNPVAELSGINVAGSFSGDNYHRTMTVTDLDAGTAQNEWHNEIVLFDKQEYGEFSETAIEIRVYEAEVDYSGELVLNRRASLTDNSLLLKSDSPVAIITGNFDGDGMQLGTPKRYQETDIFQPLVVLNAPPVHFDVLNDISYDINGCFTGGDCNFIATYEEGLSVNQQITTRLNSDWGIEAELFSKNELGGFKLNNHMKTSYGEEFSKVKTASKTVTVGVKVKAIHDDMLYATVSDYTIWEYPVYYNGEFQGHITAVVPKLVENRWFPSKSWNGYNYLPEHESGNILSYADYKELPGIIESNETIKGVENNNYALGPTTSYEWRLEFNDFVQNSATQTQKVGIEVGQEFEIGSAGSIEISGEPAGIGAAVSTDYRSTVGYNLKGNYNSESFSSHTTSVKKDLLLKVEMGSTKGEETGYQVTPYAYWSKSGTLVVDYAVAMDLAAQGYTPTWWQQEYGVLPDPAFILPWRLDPEKGYGLIDELKRQQTKDLVIYPKDPSPGDTIVVYARIHNFSLLPTNRPVSISFYLGNPETNGTLIQSNDGKTIWETTDVMAPRSHEWVYFEWIMPEEGRLFAVLDPANEMSETHEDNNVGWIALGAFRDDIVASNSTPINKNKYYTEGIQLQNYPNPFSDITYVSFNLDKPQAVRINITDLTGREIYSRDEYIRLTGEQEIEIDGTKMPAGVYILTLELETGSVSGRIMVSK